jgi:hypothetical protein
MKNASPALLSLLVALVTCVSGLGQEAGPAPAGPVAARCEAPACAAHGGGTNCWSWTLFCFPRHGCPDDYCPNPYPRQCWPPYPPFYRCVPAGACAPPGCDGRQTDRLTWWFIPTPRALHEALWCQP